MCVVNRRVECSYYKTSSMKNTFLCTYLSKSRSVCHPSCLFIKIIEVFVILIVNYVLHISFNIRTVSIGKENK